MKKTPGVPPKMGVGWAVKVRRWVVVATSKYFKSPFWKKYLHGMVLKLSGHVRNTIFLLYKQKTGWNSDIWNFFSKKIDFFSFFISLKIRFLSPAMFENVIVIVIFMILAWVKRGDPTLYHQWYQTIILWARQFQVHKGVLATPLGKPCYKKMLGRTRVNGA